METQVKPYQTESGSKKEQVEKMFDNIAGRYDFMNRFLTARSDVLWRRKAVKQLKPLKPKIILDIATGTGDFAIEAAKLNPEKIYGIDISEGMLNVGRQKIKEKGLSEVIEMLRGDGEQLPIGDNFADAITIGFGVRNFENLKAGLQEVYRVLKKEGKVVILEPSFPRTFPLNQLFTFYFKYFLPLLGRLLTKDQHAYRYLPESVGAFPVGKEFLDICKSVGFKHCSWHPLSFGVCALYVLEK